MNYNHHPRNRECNEIHYNPLSGDRSDHQRRKVISGFPRLADGQVTPGEGESRSQGPSTVNTRADGYEPRADTDNPNKLAPEEPLPSTSSARSLVEPQGPPKPPPIPPTAPIFGAKLRSHTPPEELRLRTSFSPQPRQGLPEGDGRRISVPHVGVSASCFFLFVCPDRISHSPGDPHILTAGPSRLENNRAASSSPLRQLRNGSLLCELLTGPLLTLCINSLAGTVLHCNIHGSGEHQTRWESIHTTSSAHQ